MIRSPKSRMNYSTNNSLKRTFNLFSKLLPAVKLMGMLTCISILLMSCQLNNEEKETSKELQKELQDVLEVSKDYGDEKWEDLNKNLQEIENRLELRNQEIITTYKTLSEELQEDLQAQKDEIIRQKKELDKTLEDFKNASKTKKKELKSEVIQLKNSLDKSMATFKKQMDKNKD